MAYIFSGVAAGSALAGLAGSWMSSNAAGKAADQQAAAAAQANQLQKQIYDQQRADQEPYRQAGAQALSQMQDPYFSQTFNPTDMESVDPGYNFRMQQGQQALERSAAARGGLQSGGMMKALDRYSQDYASGEYQNAYNRFTNDQTNRFNRLSSIAGMGQGANAQNAAAAQNYAAQSGQNTMGAANAQGAAGIAQANAWSNGLSGIGQAGMNAAAMANQNSWMNKWLNNQGGKTQG